MARGDGRKQRNEERQRREVEQRERGARAAAKREARLARKAGSSSASAASPPEPREKLSPERLARMKGLWPHEGKLRPHAGDGVVVADLHFAPEHRSHEGAMFWWLRQKAETVLCCSPEPGHLVVGWSL